LVDSNDLIKLTYSPDLTQAGILYVCQHLSKIQSGKKGIPDFDMLREIITQKAVELAFKRHLVQMEVPHQLVESDTFSEQDYHDIALGGRRCEVIGELVSRRADIRRMRRTPETMLNVLTLAPSVNRSSSHFGREDVVVFALVGGLVTRGWDDIKAAQAAGQPTYFIYPMPKRWTQPSEWRGLGGLALKSDTAEMLEIEIGGQDKARRFLTEKMKLPPRTRLETEKKFYSIYYLHARDAVDGRVGIHNPILKETILVQPRQWGNVWVYGTEIFLLGYMQRGEYLNNAERIPAGSRVFQARHGTRREYVGMPIKELHPLMELFQRTRSWAQR
jgi:hypothetical protein